MTLTQQAIIEAAPSAKVAEAAAKPWRVHKTEAEKEALARALYKEATGRFPQDSSDWRTVYTAGFVLVGIVFLATAGRPNRNRIMGRLPNCDSTRDFGRSAFKSQSCHSHHPSFSNGHEALPAPPQPPTSTKDEIPARAGLSSSAWSCRGIDFTAPGVIATLDTSECPGTTWPTASRRWGSRGASRSLSEEVVPTSEQGPRSQTQEEQSAPARRRFIGFALMCRSPWCRRESSA